MIKRIILFILVILWMIIIFYFSSFNGVDSREQSRGFLYNTLDKIISIFDKDISEIEKEELIIKYDPVVRKIAHVSEFLILSILVLLLLNTYDLNKDKILLYTFLICFLYSCSDEIHQLFVSERSGKFTDVLVDSIGIIIPLIIVKIFRRRNIYD